MADSSITIVGGLGRDPEIRYTAAGRAVATLGVAVSRRWMDRKSNEWQEQTSWFDVVVWGDMAENVSDTLSKGARVIVTGRLEQRSWENEQGEKRSKVEIVAEEIGVSLRWATAEVKRSERRSGGSGGDGDYGGGGGGRPGGGSNAPGGGSSGGSDGAATSGAPTPSGGGEHGYDEEPF